jgi:hypothetical protein
MPNHSASLLKQMLKQVSGTCALTYTRHSQVPFFICAWARTSMEN